MQSVASSSRVHHGTDSTTTPTKGIKPKQGLIIHELRIDACRAIEMSLKMGNLANAMFWADKLRTWTGDVADVYVYCEILRRRQEYVRCKSVIDNSLLHSKFLCFDMLHARCLFEIGEHELAKTTFSRVVCYLEHVLEQNPGMSAHEYFRTKLPEDEISIIPLFPKLIGGSPCWSTAWITKRTLFSNAYYYRGLLCFEIGDMAAAAANLIMAAVCDPSSHMILSTLTEKIKLTQEQMQLLMKKIVEADPGFCDEFSQLIVGLLGNRLGGVSWWA